MSLGEKFLEKYKKGYRSDYDMNGPTKGCTIYSRQEWVLYPETGGAWQNDKEINRRVQEYMKGK